MYNKRKENKAIAARQQSANNEHCAQQEEARARLQMLMELVNSPESRDHGNKNWSDVGTMSKINNDLRQICNFAGIERSSDY